jgi:hypothetical protein
MHLVESLKVLLVEDLQRCVPISPKEWDFFSKAQYKGFLKKYPPASDSGAADRRVNAVSKFLDTVAHLRSHSCTYPDPDILRTLPKGDINEADRALVRARSICHNLLGRLSTDDWFSKCKHGPNSSLGVPFSDSGNSRKFQPPWTATESAVGVWEHYLRYDDLLARSLARSCPELRRPGGLWLYVDLVESSRLTTVPKNDTTDRTIAIEPTVNMYLQQGLGRLIAEKLAVVGVDIQKQQDVHRKMAFEASLSRKYATIDFSSASDCVETGLLKFLLPPEWFEAVVAVRCDSVMVEGSRIELPCIATMGNATTFVLETLVFYALAIASIMKPTRTLLPEWEDFKRVSVFGDDCIVPVEAARFFMDLCKRVGFIVNEDKSFYDKLNPFRESCGADFLGGYNVRPVMITGPRSPKPSSLRAWLYVLWNVLSKRLLTSLGERNYAYSLSLQFLAREISRHNQELYLIASNDPEDAGLKTWGDWGRLSRLFTIPVAVGLLDSNHTLHYRRLVTTPPKAGFETPELEMWLKLKFPTVIDPLRPKVGLKDFTVQKGPDRGYVVSWASSFDDALLDCLELDVSKTFAVKDTHSKAGMKQNAAQTVSGQWSVTDRGRVWTLEPNLPTRYRKVTKGR